LNPGDVVVGVLPGAAETKVRPAVVIASEAYMRERPDVLLGILTTRKPQRPASSDFVLQDWQSAGLKAESYFRVFVLTIHRSELTVIGRLSERDWREAQACVRRAFAI
jgi:mRNA interferase MazF